MDLTTTYLGLKLSSPIVPSSSPLWRDLDAIKQAEDAGAGAIVLHSIFEEQIRMEQFELEHHLTANTESFSEAESFFPSSAEYFLGPEEYLNHIRKAKAAVRIPVIASLNGSTLGGWTEFAQKMEQAGADAIELNIYHIPTDRNVSGGEIEDQYFQIVKAVKSVLHIPVSVKLSPYFSNLANFAKHLESFNVNGLVLFNRFYQPNINIETLEVLPEVLLSTPQALRLPMRWIAILYGRIKADLAATSGVGGAEDVVKMIMAGANVTMLCSALLKNGIGHIKTVLKDLKEWMEKHDYPSIGKMIGIMSQVKCENPSEYERAQYIRTLQSYKSKKL